VLRGIVHFLQTLGLTRGQTLAFHQFAEAEDGGHRGADLVAHVGQEGTLRLVCRLRLVHCVGQLARTFFHAGFQTLRQLAQTLRQLAQFLFRSPGVVEFAQRERSAARRVDAQVLYHANQTAL